MKALDRDLVATAVALIRGSGDGLCSSLGLLPISENGKGAETCAVVIDPCRIAPLGVVLRVYDGRSHSGPDCFQLRDLLARDLLPHIVGRGECRVVWEESTECWVILSGNPDDDS